MMPTAHDELLVAIGASYTFCVHTVCSAPPHPIPPRSAPLRPNRNIGVAGAFTGGCEAVAEM